MGEMGRDPILDMFIFETNQLLEQLEDIMLTVEQEGDISTDNINEIFRAMHTIKGSAAMMSYDNISVVAHRIEDLFFKIRENNSVSEEEFSRVCDIVFEGKDFIKEQMELVEAGEEATDTNDDLINRISDLLAEMNGEQAAKEEKTEKTAVKEVAPLVDASISGTSYSILVKFEEDCKMENVRAFSVLNEVEKHSSSVTSVPAELFDDPSAGEVIASDGLMLYVVSELSQKQLEKIIKSQICVESVTFMNDEDSSDVKEEKIEKQADEKSEIKEVKEVKKAVTSAKDEKKTAKKAPAKSATGSKQSLINVSVDKLDALLDFVGEIVIAQSMVVQNPELNGLQLDNFRKSAEQLQKLTKELQDVVMAIRMIPIASAFHKMNRIVRDMSKTLNKDVELVISGEETEVDKTIIDSLSDPLMHLVRNCMDHGLETTEERIAKGKPAKGKVMLRAYNNGNNVVVTVSDDGKGLDREKILNKALDRGLITGNIEEITDQQIYECILLPGFSTKEAVTEFSGRGVGMDVVKSNLEAIGGTISLDSKPNEGTTFTIKIPLTLAIIDGMSVAVGDMSFIIPMTSVKEAIRCKTNDVAKDPYGKERMLIRGKYYDVVRLYEKYDIETDITEIDQAILIAVEHGNEIMYVMVDAILGEQQVVIKPLPKYLQKNLDSDCAFSGCTILGDGNVGFIINTNEL